MILRRTILLLWLTAGMLVAAPIPLDVVFSADKEAIVGRVKDIETLFLVIAVEGEKEPARVPLDELTWVDFGESRLLDGFLRQAASASVPDLQKFWEQRRALLEVPGSTGGAIGLRLVQRYLAQRTLTAAGRALELAELLVEKDWNPETKKEALVLRVRALLALGRGLEAAAALDRVAETGVAPSQRNTLAILKGDLELQRGTKRGALEHYLTPYVLGGSSSADLVRVGLERALAVARQLPDAEARLKTIEAQLGTLESGGKEVK